MRIINIRTWLYKDINLDDYSVHELNGIYEFYKNNNNFAVIIDGEVQ